jgi:Gpi18-like mannosyltransferase
MYYLKNKINLFFIWNKPSSDIKKIIGMFLVWKSFLYIFLFLGFLFVPLGGKNFFGGGLERYNQYFYLLPWANFDGEHYMSIAMNGYQSLEQAFFPLYPVLIYIGKWFFPNNFVVTATFGLIISNLALIGALVFLYKLVRLDYSAKIGWITIALLLFFPTSFYLGAVYTESLFLLLSVGTFYFARQEKWWIAALFGILACTTRVFGVLLLPALLIDIFIYKKLFKKWYPILLIPTGLLIYMIYLFFSVGDPFAFYNLQSIIGEHRQKGIVLFPQVIYRYLNILIHYQKIDIFLATFLLEFITTLIFFVVPILAYFKKVRLSYIFYSLISLLVPTVQGSFSSGSRYVLVIFPVFIMMALFFVKWPRIIQVLMFIVLSILLMFFSILFLRGYWVA